MINYNGTNDYYPENLGKIYYADNSDNDWADYRQSILESRGKSQDDFEKYINIFSSGGLLIGLTLLSKLIETEFDYRYHILIIIGSLLFVLSIIANVFSHYLAISNDECTIAEIDCRHPEILNNIDERNLVIKILNRTSIFSISIATILISIFLIINLTTMRKKSENPQGKPNSSQGDPKPLNEEKGRTTQKPAFEIKPKKS